MALHPVEPPPEARDLRRIVALLRLLLKALAKHPSGSGVIGKIWLEGIWKTQSPDWIKRFCRKREFSVLDPLQIVGKASPAFRSALYKEFCRQNRLRAFWNEGGIFNGLASLPDSTEEAVKATRQLFDRFYDFLGIDSKCGWLGYEFANDRAVRKDQYGENFQAANWPRLRVCPYCDGPNDLPELDHYYAKSHFPLLAVSPWNLIPICSKCNDTTRGGKGNKPALTTGAARPAGDWLHPFFAPASAGTVILLSGGSRDAIPRLHSDDPNERQKLGNHESLIPNLSKRWTGAASDYFDTLVNRVREQIEENGETVDHWVRQYLRDHRRGLEPMALVRAAVCQAVLDRRPEYILEFENPNILGMS